MSRPSLLRELVYAGIIQWKASDIEEAFRFLLSKKLDPYLFARWLKHQPYHILDPDHPHTLLWWAEGYAQWQSGHQ